MRNPARACGPGFYRNGWGSNMQGDWEQQAMKVSEHNWCCFAKVD
jgi:hypothetical protein